MTLSGSRCLFDPLLAASNLSSPFGGFFGTACLPCGKNISGRAEHVGEEELRQIIAKAIQIPVVPAMARIMFC